MTLYEVVPETKRTICLASRLTPVPVDLEVGDDDVHAYVRLSKITHPFDGHEGRHNSHYFLAIVDDFERGVSSETNHL